MAPGILIPNAMLIEQSARRNVQPHCQGIRLHLNAQHTGQRCGRSPPFGCARVDQPVDCLQQRIGRLLPSFSLRLFQLPQQFSLVSNQVQLLIRLVASRDFQKRSVRGSLFLRETLDRVFVCRTQQTVRSGNHVKPVLRLLLARVVHNHQADVLFVCKGFQLNDVPDNRPRSYTCRSLLREPSGACR